MKAKIVYETKFPNETEYRRIPHAVPVTTVNGETPANAFHRLFLATFGNTLEYRIIRVIKPKTVQYDYYIVELPGDLEPNGPMWLNDICNHAITQARERSKLYCMPCEWTTKLVKGNAHSNVVIRVCRKRNRNH